MGWTLFPKDPIDRMPPNAKLELTVQDTTSWFYAVPKRKVVVKGRANAHVVAESVREAGGRVLGVRRKGWRFW